METILISAIVSCIAVVAFNAIMDIRKRRQQKLKEETQADWERFQEREAQHQQMVQERGWIYSLELTYDELNRRNKETPGWIDINALLDVYAKAILKVTQVPQKELEHFRSKTEQQWIPFHADISFGEDSYVITARRYTPKDFIRRIK